MILNAKEKAKELVEKYAIWAWNEVYCDYEVAKQCALIAVDEMIMQNGDIYLNSFVSDVITFYKQKNAYLFEVKTEIEKL